MTPPVVQCPFIDVDDVEFVPEGSEIPQAPIDSREAITATGALAVITVVSVDQYGQPGVSNMLSNELRRATTEKGRRLPDPSLDVGPDQYSAGPLLGPCARRGHEDIL